MTKRNIKKVLLKRYGENIRLRFFMEFKEKDEKAGREYFVQCFEIKQIARMLNLKMDEDFDKIFIENYKEMYRRYNGNEKINTKNMG